MFDNALIIAIIDQLFDIAGENAAEGGPCPISHYCPLNTSTPLPCEPGEYNNLTTQAECFPCPASYFCTGNISDYEYFPCPQVLLPLLLYYDCNVHHVVDR